MSRSASLESAATEIGIEIVASLAQHRVLSAAQVRAIHLPASGERWAQRMLVRLGDAGLAGYVRSPRSHRRLWHVTELGANVAREAGALDGEPRLIGAQGAAGPLQAHTLAVNDAAICFLEAGRERAMSSARSPGATRSPTRSPEVGAAGAGRWSPTPSSPTCCSTAKGWRSSSASWSSTARRSRSTAWPPSWPATPSCIG